MNKTYMGAAMNRNQKGAIDMMLVAAVAVVLVVGGFVLWRITSSDESSDADSNEQATEEVSQAESSDMGNETETSQEEASDGSDEEVESSSDGGTTISVQSVKIENLYDLTNYVPTEGESDVQNITAVYATLENTSGAEVEYWVEDFSAVTSGGEVVNVGFNEDAANQFNYVTLVDGGKKEVRFLFDTTEELSELRWASEEDQTSVEL